MPEHDPPTALTPPKGKHSFEILLTNGYQEYKNIAIDRQQIQLRYTQTYISIASVIVGAITSALIFFKVAANGQLPPPTGWLEVVSFFCFALSLILALGVFICGVDLLRGRENRPIPFANIKSSFTWAKENCNKFMSEEDLEIALLKSLLDPVADGLTDLIKIVARIGARLRFMSLALIGAAVFGLTGVLIRVFIS